MTRLVSRLAVGTVVGIAIVLGGRSLSVAQEVTGPALKAAFLFNFVKFTTWPADVLPEAAPLVMCVVNDPAVGVALSHAVGGRVVLGHQIQVVQPANAEPLDKCQVVYV